MRTLPDIGSGSIRINIAYSEHQKNGRNNECLCPPTLWTKAEILYIFIIDIHDYHHETSITLSPFLHLAAESVSIFSSPRHSYGVGWLVMCSQASTLDYLSPARSLASSCVFHEAKIFMTTFFMFLFFAIIHDDDDDDDAN